MDFHKIRYECYANGGLSKFLLQQQMACQGERPIFKRQSFLSETLKLNNNLMKPYVE